MKRIKGIAPKPASGVSRVHLIEITLPTAWMVDGELWRFRHGAHLTIGGANDLDSPEPMVTPAIALGLINAGKAQALDVTELENLDLENVEEG